MTIIEYINANTTTATEAAEIAETLRALYLTAYDDFATWAAENGINLAATDPITGEYIVNLWAADL
jgi:hypothetical protein